MDKFRKIIGNMESLNKNQDGTFKGGFISASGRRYRLILGNFTGWADTYPTNGHCTGTQENSACENSVCPGSTNAVVVEGTHETYCHNGNCPG